MLDQMIYLPEKKQQVGKCSVPEALGLTRNTVQNNYTSIVKLSYTN